MYVSMYVAIRCPRAQYAGALHHDDFAHIIMILHSNNLARMLKYRVLERDL